MATTRSECKRLGAKLVSLILAGLIVLLVAVPALAQDTGGFISPESTMYTEEQYFGKKISMDFQDADIKSILRIISDVSGLNIVAGDDVQGKITIKLNNVPWDQALDIILRTKKLAIEREGNIIRVAPTQTLTTERQQELARQQISIQLEPLAMALIPVSYADANDLVPQIRSILSNRGVANVDERTNIIVIQDIERSIKKAKRLIASLDSQTPQVLIQTRIVEATTDFTREMGIKWGGIYYADAGHGNPTGLSFPNSVRVTGSDVSGQQFGEAGATQGVGTSGFGNTISTIPNANYAVNLPAPIGLGSGGGVGITLGSINDTFALDLQLSALESRGEGRVISRPEVTTLDNKQASITQGVSIPFQIRQQGETSLSFIEANLNMTVTPHVTADESIIMKIEIAKNAPNTSIPTSTGDPAIDKKEVVTEVLVRNGETSVIGGIFSEEESRTELGVPWLSRIPVLGMFFRDREQIKKRSELLIFITPRIVRDRPAV
ncbi:MAG: type IV pilus secretin PilQ [Candidatus Lernaella stagnicola]|nr:type IV pilus secretin PilQ [Candidatus Lernaella stagnicola]